MTSIYLLIFSLLCGLTAAVLGNRSGEISVNLFGEEEDNG